MRTLYSLLIGINEYPSSVSSLAGCVNDTREVNTYLAAYALQQGLEYRPLRLENKQATRDGIINAFAHFDEAEDGDICVWFYAGHGSLAPAPEQFWHQAPDHLHECLVCWDSREPGGRELLDKEMSWLLWKATKDKDLHFLVLMDCCFSGTNLRLEGGQVRRCRMRNTTDLIPLEDYLGYEDYQREGQHLFPPRGKYLQLAASKSNQPAQEMHFDGDGTHGVFTFALLDQLKASGLLATYGELHQRVRARVNSLVPEQSPQLDYSVGDFSEQLFLRPEKPISGSRNWVFFSQDDRTWRLNRGSIEGLQRDEGEVMGVVISQKNIKARIKEVHASYAIVEPEQRLDREQVYAARLNKPLRRKLAVALAPDFPAADREALERAFERVGPEYVSLKDSPAEATHWVRLDKKKELALYPRGGQRPAFRRVALSLADRFWKDTELMGQWDYFYWLDNPETELPPNALKFTIYQYEAASFYSEDSPREEVHWPQPLRLDYRRLSGKWQPAAFSCKITNTSDRDLWVSVLFLGNAFTIVNSLLAKIQLKAGKPAWLNYKKDSEERTIIPNYIEKPLRKIGVTRNPERIKVIASTEELDLDRYNKRKGLKPEPLKSSFRVPGQEEEEIEERSDIELSDWLTYVINLVTRCPQDDKPIAANRAVEWYHHLLQVPVGFSAHTNLHTLEDISEQLPLPISPILGEELGDFTPYAWTPGHNLAPGLKVLSLSSVEGANQLSSWQPFQIELPVKNESAKLAPLAYDAKTGRLGALPYSVRGGQLELHRLPAPTSLENGEKKVLIFLHYIATE